MRFLLLVIDDPLEEGHRPGELDAAGWVADMEARGVRVTGGRVRAADARTVRVREDGVRVTEGPFADTVETIGGFDVIECRDLDEAVELVATHPVARYGQVEIRPFWQ